MPHPLSPESADSKSPPSALAGYDPSWPDHVGAAGAEAAPLAAAAAAAPSPPAVESVGPVAGRAQSGSASASAGGGDGSDQPLSDALLLYLKAMGLVKRAVELGRRILEGLPPPPPPSADEASVDRHTLHLSVGVSAAAASAWPPAGRAADWPGAAAAGGERARHLLRWLSDQFGLILARADQCRAAQVQHGAQHGSPAAASGGGAKAPEAPGAGQEPSSSSPQQSPPPPPAPSQQHGNRAEQRIYRAALQLARAAAIKEVLGHTVLALTLYRHGQLLIEALLLEPGLPAADRELLAGYDRGFQQRLDDLDAALHPPSPRSPPKPLSPTSAGSGGGSGGAAAGAALDGEGAGAAAGGAEDAQSPASGGSGGSATGGVPSSPGSLGSGGGPAGGGPAGGGGSDDDGMVVPPPPLGLMRRSPSDRVLPPPGCDLSPGGGGDSGGVPLSPTRRGGSPFGMGELEDGFDDDAAFA